MTSSQLIQPKEPFHASLQLSPDRDCRMHCLASFHDGCAARPAGGASPASAAGTHDADSADTRAQQLWEQQIAALRPQLQAELDQNEIKAGDKAMKLLVKQFGTAPSSGAALYISMHGGGGAPPNVNDQQWRNQIQLYQPEEGYYVAPRAPNEYLEPLA